MTAGFGPPSAGIERLGEERNRRQDLPADTTNPIDR
jgi:hypothetical protein